MAGLAGTFAGAVTAESIGLVAGVNTQLQGTANTAALQAAIGSLDSGSDKPITIQFPSSDPYYFYGAVNTPCERFITLDLLGSGRFVNLHSTDPIIKLYLQNSNGWFDGGFNAKDGKVTGNGGFLGTNNSLTLRARLAKLWLSGLELQTTKRPVELTMEYSVDCLIERCGFKGNAWQEGGLFWKHGIQENHASSLIKINRCHFIGTNLRMYPALHMEGHRAPEISGCIFEGNTGWGDGSSPDAYKRALAIYLDYWGFNDTIIEHCWQEYNDYGTRNQDRNIVLNSTVPNNGGIDAPQRVFIKHCNLAYLSVYNDATSIVPFTVFGENPYSSAASISRTDPGTSGIYLSGKCDFRFIGPTGGIDQQSTAVLQSGDNAAFEYEGQGPQDNYRVNWIKPAAKILYEFKGGTGNDGLGITKQGNINVFPHRHPIYGSGIALRGYQAALQLPMSRAIVDGRRVYHRMLICSPNHVIQGGMESGLWASHVPVGQQFGPRTIPDGYAPYELSGSLDVADYPRDIIRLLDWWSGQGGVYNYPTSPWILVYGLTASYYDSAPVSLHIDPTTSWEYVAGEGPPPGTYGLGDVILGRDRHLQCSRPGTSRTISFSASQTANSAIISLFIPGDYLEGEWIQNTRNEEAQIISVNSNATLTLDRVMKTTGNNLTFRNYNPLWKVR